MSTTTTIQPPSEPWNSLWSRHKGIIVTALSLGFIILSNFFGNINLPLGVIGHEGSTILVIISGLRLLR